MAKWNLTGHPAILRKDKQKLRISDQGYPDKVKDMGTRENLHDQIYGCAPDDTPFFIGKGSKGK